MSPKEFEQQFENLTFYLPLPWQSRLYFEFFDQGNIPASVDIPTGLGKTTVTALWLIAIRTGRTLPRRLIYIVDRRAVVDQATRFVEDLRKNEEKLRKEQKRPEEGPLLPISTLRGQHADNREWLDDPGEPAIIVGTVDMIGSRLLFEGYGVSRKMRPYHAGLLGTDSLFVLDEAHLVPPFERLLRDIARERNTSLGAADEADRGLLPPLRVMSLSATGRESTTSKQTFSLDDRDINAAGAGAKLTRKRLDAAKTLYLNTCKRGELVETLAEKVWTIAESGAKAERYLIFCHARKDATDVQLAFKKRIEAAGFSKDSKPETELFVGARRNYERKIAEERLEELGFIEPQDTETQDTKEPSQQANLCTTSEATKNKDQEKACFLIATSAGEVGVDMDADHMICDLVAWDRMVQRLGRVNRRGDGDAQVYVYDTRPPDAKSNETDLAPSQTMLQHTRSLIEALPSVADGGHDASPGAIRKLKHRIDAGIIAKASTPAPLRPTITRPLLDAWAMTSLRDHTGRPEVAPWLRGWVDDPPRTTVVWRKYLPIREKPAVTEKEIEAFFEAAPIHISETLETETFHVVKWLKARAAKFNDQAKNRVCGVLLTADGKYVQTIYAKDLLDKSENDKFSGKTLVLSACFGGLKKGLLAPNEKDGWLSPDIEAMQLPATIDGDTSMNATIPPTIRFRIIENDPESGEDDDDAWRENLRFTLKRNEDGEATQWLSVQKWRDASNTEDDRAQGRPQALAEHQAWAEEHAQAIGRKLGLSDEYAAVLTTAARLHDEGKRARNWQRAFQAERDAKDFDIDCPLAKTRGPINQNVLGGYRHEFGSLPYAKADADFMNLSQEQQDLVLHLIAAHHGRARPSISIAGCEDAPRSKLQERAHEVALRFARLQKRWGPWGLAWWEALLRAADMKASSKNDKRGKD